MGTVSKAGRPSLEVVTMTCVSDPRPHFGRVTFPVILLKECLKQTVIVAVLHDLRWLPGEGPPQPPVASGAPRPVPASSLGQAVPSGCSLVLRAPSSAIPLDSSWRLLRWAPEHKCCDLTIRPTVVTFSRAGAVSDLSEPWALGRACGMKVCERARGRE